MAGRIVMHVDFDYFYAQCEEIRNPIMKTRPVCVCVYSDRGGDSGAIATANYIARKYGVKSGMPISFAKRKLADADGAEFIPVDFKYYSQVSEESMEEIAKFADVFEYVGRDEAYLDVGARTEFSFDAAARLGQQIKNAVRTKSKIVCSIGISPNRMISKIASDYKKPDGLTIVRPDSVNAFLEPLEIVKIPGIGKKTEQRLSRMGLKTIRDLKNADLFLLTKEFGRKSGTYIYNAARGVDEEPVKERAPRIQYSRIVTLSEDSGRYEFLKENLARICSDVHGTVMENRQMFKVVGVQFVKSDLSVMSRSRTLKSPTASAYELQKNAEHLLAEALKSQGANMSVRRLGVMVTELSDARGQSDITEASSSRDGKMAAWTELVAHDISR